MDQIVPSAPLFLKKVTEREEGDYNALSTTSPLLLSIIRDEREQGSF